MAEDQDAGGAGTGDQVAAPATVKGWQRVIFFARLQFSSQTGDGMARGYHRFKDSLRGSIEHLGSSYPCLVEDISQRGLYLVTNAPVKIGDRMSIVLYISKAAGFHCVIEIRQVTPDGLGAEVVDIADADAAVLSLATQ